MSRFVSRVLLQTLRRRYSEGLPRVADAGRRVHESPLGPVPLQDVTLTEYVWQEHTKYASRPAITCGASGRTYSFEQAREMCWKFASALRRTVGLNGGDVIGVVLPNLPEYLVAIHGAIEAGMYVTFANPLYTAGEIKRQFEDSNVKCIITISPLMPTIQEVIQVLKNYQKTILVDTKEHNNSANILSMKKLIEDAKPASIEPISTDQIAIIPYSSGTTGLPKGVMLSHRNLVSNMCQISHPRITNFVKTTDTQQDISLTVLPFFHIYGFNGILNFNLSLGLQVISLPKFTPEDYIEALIKYQPTSLFVVPSLLLFLASHPAVKKDHLRSIKKVVSGAAPATKSLIDKFQAKVDRDDIVIVQGYGMTETSPVTLYTPNDRPDGKSFSCGLVIPHTQAMIVDIENGKSLGPYKSGELWVKGPQVMLGYFNNKAATDETLDSDGWLHTGDVMYYDDEGYFYIVDRTKELIKVKGNQVSPTELENIIMELPSVADVAVVGIPDDLAGELPRAFVVQREGAPIISDKDIIDYVKPKVASYKQLAGGVTFVDNIPRNHAGKILRNQLKVLKR